MGSSGARLRRQQRRAKEHNRGLVVQADLDAVKGMKLPDACGYAKEKNLRIRIFSLDGEKRALDKDCCTDIINVDLVDGIVVKAKACNLKKPKESFFKLIDDIESLPDNVEIVACPNKKE